MKEFDITYVASEYRTARVEARTAEEAERIFEKHGEDFDYERGNDVEDQDLVIICVQEV